MRIEFPESLPVSGRRADILAALAEHPVVIVSGATGSGKTTQLPKMCLAAGRGQNGLIGHTQPRRLAATSVARRIAQELGTPLGTDVGFKVRFNESVAPSTRIKLMTDGILLAETLSDPLLKRYDTLLIDEAHERSLNIDFLLGYLKELLAGPRRHDLKLIITSATIDAERFAAHFGQAGRPAPVIDVAGRSFPVEIRWRPLDALRAAAGPGQAERQAEAAEPDWAHAVEAAIDELWQGGHGDVLVFLPGEREIRATAEHLRRAWGRRSTGAGWLAAVELFPLYARLSAREQQRVFESGRGLRVVLTTNVAETSLTVPGIRYVVDTGLARVKRYRYRGKVDQLQIEPISQAAANQRAGRCGRVAAGVCIRLYSELDFQRRPAFTDPEVMRVSLAGVMLRMKALKLPEIESFPFVDPPSKRAIQDGYDLLFELAALDEHQALTSVGQQLARWPLDPRIGRMVLAARDLGCLRELLVIAAALSVQDPRERPLERQQAADQAHARWHDPRSDFVSWLKLWEGCVPQAQPGAEQPSRKSHWARLGREFLAPHKLQEWLDVHAQLEQVVTDLGWPMSSRPNDYEALHRALLAGLLGNLGLRAPDEPWYYGTHATKFWLHPGSGVGRRGAGAPEAARPSAPAPAAPRWLMAAEMVDTGKLYARTAARIEPNWIEQAAGHLIRCSWSEPHWEKRAGQAMAFERGVVYGLTVYAQRRVSYTTIDPRLARELLIREGLVAGQWETPCAFFAHNRRVIAQVQELEAKMRRPDVLVDEQFLFDWFDAQIPAEVLCGADLERWWRRTSATQPELLCLSPAQLMRKQAEGVDHRRFPPQMLMRGMAFDLSYQFDPGAEHDGVTLEVPLYALNQVDAVRAEWLVPGMLPDKVLALLKSLPQKVRRVLQPIDRWAEQCVARRSEDDWARPLIEVLIQDLREHQGVRVTAADFRLEAVPAHGLMNFRVRDEHGRVVGASRHLAALRAQWGGQAQGSFQAALRRAGLTEPREAPGRPADSAPAPAASAPAVPRPSTPPADDLPPMGARLTEWSFGPLLELLELPVAGAQGSETLIGYSALVDRADAVSLELFDEPERAQREHRAGLRRLFALALRESLRAIERQVSDWRSLEMAYGPLSGGARLSQDWSAAVLEHTCMAAPLPADRTAFLARLAEARPRLSLVGQELGRTLAQILAEDAAVRKKLAAAKAFPEVVADIEQQRAALFPPQFVLTLGAGVLGHLPRYLKAIGVRLDRLRGDPARDAARMAEIRPLLQRWQRAQAALKGRSEPWLQDYRWLLEELRVSLFAQELRTPTPVSVKRLEKMWDSLSRGSF